MRRNWLSSIMMLWVVCCSMSVDAATVSGEAFKSDQIDHSGITILLESIPEVPTVGFIGAGLLVLSISILLLWRRNRAVVMSMLIVAIAGLRCVSFAFVLYTTQTIDTGEWSLLNVDPGNYRLEASAPGYYSEELIPLAIVDGGNLIQDITLYPIETPTPGATDTPIPTHTPTEISTSTPTEPPTSTSTATPTPVAPSPLPPNVWAVNYAATGANTGTTWTDAFTTLDAALTAAMTGDEIWVARGTYSPGTTSTSDSFALKDAVDVYGGFLGYEGSLDDRDPELNPTVLDGADTCFHVLTCSGTSPVICEVDGFVIQNGNASGSGADATGAGALITAAASNQGKKVTFRNCRFIDNSAATEGGAVYVSRYTTTSFTDCVFETNTSGSNGGAIFGVRFTLITMLRCEFSTNSTSGTGVGQGGGAVFLTTSVTSETASISDCIFNDNSTPATSSADNGGGAMNLYINPGTVTIRGCQFTGNSGHYGAGIFPRAGSSASADLSSVVVDDCSFESNTATYGAAVFSATHNTIVKNTMIRGNTSTQHAAVYFRGTDTDPQLLNSLVSGNEATVHGCVYVNNCNLSITNSTVAGNFAEFGGGVSGIGGAQITAHNSLFYGNDAANGTQIYLTGATTTMTATKCCYPSIAGSVMTVSGAIFTPVDAVMEDPEFIDPVIPTSLSTPNTSGDYSLPITSPCVDAGDDAAISEAYDVRGYAFPRKHGTVDIGCYENQEGYLVTFIVHKPDDDVLEGANVTTDGVTLQTSVNGEAVFVLLPGSYPFSVEMAGYVTAEGLLVVDDQDVEAPLGLFADFQLRDTGPASGWIFYINSNFETDGWRYLEAAPAPGGGDTAIRYSNVPSLIGTTSTDIGSGPFNTAAIIGQAGFTNGAALVCSDYINATYDDWFLASRDELNQMYINLHQQGVGSFTISSYWSSSEYSATNAYRQSFSSGTQSNSAKTTTYGWRPARRFTSVYYYQLTYDGNGNTAGSVSSSSWYYPKGDSSVNAQSGDGLVRVSDDFVCWNTRSDGFGTDYYEGDPINLGDNLTLYAKYESSMLVFIPDTQSYVRYREEVMEDQVAWIVANAGTANIRFAGHVGDLVQDHEDVTSQWDFVQEQMGLIGAVIPYSIVPGNHDYVEGTRDSTMMNSYFPLSGFQSMSTFGGAFDTKCDNTWHIVDVHGEDWLIVSLEMGPRTSVVDWADGIIAANSEKPVIVVTHAYLKGQTPGTGNLLTHSDNHAASNGYGLGNGPPDVNDGDDLWDALIYPNNNIRFVFCGHDGTEDIGSALRITQHSDGSSVYQILSNFQYWASYPGYLALLKFDSTGVVMFRTYSPTLDALKEDAQSQGDWS